MQPIDRLRFDMTSTLLRVGRQWRRLVRELMLRHGLSEACAHPLVVIARLGDGTRQVTVAEEVGIEGPSLVRLLDQLCGCGLVERRDDPVDRRAKTLWLTKLGRRTTGLIEDDLVALRRDVLGDIDAADLAATIRVFQALERGVASSSGHGGQSEDQTP
ncbi:MAG: MarR family transcriptional regulator [Hyphomicrobiales bacterium]|nr:MAG: MarR family transcriptional regulator [Hyphomicrobiales bacterium]